MKKGLETQLIFNETFEPIAVECSGRLIQALEHSLERLSLIEDNILSNPIQYKYKPICLGLS